MKISAQDVYALRKASGMGIKECQMALEAVDNNFDLALVHLGKSGADFEAKPCETTSGLVYSYVHGGGKLGVLLEMSCATDFVAKTEEFVALARDICLHIAAMNPICICFNDVSETEKNNMVKRVKILYPDSSESMSSIIYMEEFDNFCREYCLVEQVFVKDGSRTIKDLIKELEIKVKEPISVKRFARYVI